MKIALAGATGLVGQAVINELNSVSGVEVTGFVRRSLPENLNYKNLVIDWDNWNPESLKVNGSVKFDVFICCLGTTMKQAQSKDQFKKVDFDYVLKCARFAKAQNISKFILISANGANANSPFYYNQIKGLIEQELTHLQLNFLDILRPSLLIGTRSEKRFAESLAQHLFPKIDFLLQGHLKKYQSIKATDVAQAICYLALKNLENLQSAKVSIYESDQIKELAKKLRAESP